MGGILYITVLLGILLAWAFVLRAHRSIRETTLVSAWLWSMVAVTMWAVIWFADQCLTVISTELADHAWYANAVLSLCPPMAVLGSRRPGTRVWTWFILWPMLLALGWPVITLWLQGSELRGLQLETPQLVTFCLVLLMGVGNYCGTRFTVSALLYGASTLALVVSSSANSAGWLSDRVGIRFWSTVLMLLAVWMIRTSSRPIAATKFDQLWFDFFDTFGIVWGRRIQDRINFIAAKEGLPVRLELDGFAGITAPDRSSVSLSSDAPIANANEVEARVEHILRWLLRRFVDPVWIDHRLGADAVPKDNDLTVDS